MSLNITQQFDYRENVFIAEWVPYQNDEEKIVAQNYLENWKYFILKKHQDLQFCAEQWIDKDLSHFMERNPDGTYPPLELKPGIKGTLALKLQFKEKECPSS